MQQKTICLELTRQHVENEHGTEGCMEAHVQMCAVESTYHTVMKRETSLPVIFVILQKLDKAWQVHQSLIKQTLVKNALLSSKHQKQVTRKKKNHTLKLAWIEAFKKQELSKLTRPPYKGFMPCHVRATSLLYKIFLGLGGSRLHHA